MLPSRCTQLPCRNRAVTGESACAAGAANSSAGTTPQWRKYTRSVSSSAYPEPYPGTIPDAGPSTKIRQHRAMRPYVVGAA